MDEEDEYDDRERIFHSTVREYIIYLLLFLALFILSYTIIDHYRKKDHEEYIITDEDEAVVYKVSLYLCVFALAVTICAALLHPFSILSNEILLLYPKSYYVKWLNHSLIQGIWNLVFLFSNLSLFGLLPFAYLFTESEGFSGYRKGVKSRVYETGCVLILLIFVAVGLSFVISALVDVEGSTFLIFQSFGIAYLPFLYSCIAFLGVILLIVCTPLGFIRMFGVLSKFLVKPLILHNVNDEYFVVLMEKALAERRLKQVMESGRSYIKPEPMFVPPDESGDRQFMSLQNGELQSGLKKFLEDMEKRKDVLEKQKSSSIIHRNFVYPAAMLTLVALTFITVFLVLINTLQLLIGIKALPKSTAQFTLGLTSLSKLGTIGATIEVVLIIYLAVTSLVGFYNFPFLAKARPQAHRTPLSLLIANCAVLLILSSALPLLARILDGNLACKAYVFAGGQIHTVELETNEDIPISGITNFDLLGHFGNIVWLGNFNIVFSYNIVFAGVTTLVLINQLTAPVCKDFFNRVRSFFSGIRTRRRKRNRVIPPIPASVKED